MNVPLEIKTPQRRQSGPNLARKKEGRTLGFRIFWTAAKGVQQIATPLVRFGALLRQNRKTPVNTVSYCNR
jgi:hypothetical protein